MIYSYTAISSTVRRPIIEIIVKSDKNFVIYPVLIDSGADYCIFDIDIANILGIRLNGKSNFIGIGKDKVQGFWGNVEVRIETKTYNTKVIFAKIGQFSHGVLGQQGFFDRFDVKLSYQKQTIEVKPAENVN